MVFLSSGRDTGENRSGLHSPSLTWNLKMMVSKRNLLFQGAMFGFHVKLREGRLKQLTRAPKCITGHLLESLNMSMENSHVQLKNTSSNSLFSLGYDDWPERFTIYQYELVPKPHQKKWSFIVTFWNDFLPTMRFWYFFIYLYRRNQCLESETPIRKMVVKQWGWCDQNLYIKKMAVFLVLFEVVQATLVE